MLERSKRGDGPIVVEIAHTMDIAMARCDPVYFYYDMLRARVEPVAHAIGVGRQGMPNLLLATLSSSTSLALPVQLPGSVRPSICFVFPHSAAFSVPCTSGSQWPHAAFKCPLMHRLESPVAWNRDCPHRAIYLNSTPSLRFQ